MKRPCRLPRWGTRSLLAAGVGFAVALAGGATAFGYWAAPGVGGGSATNATMATVTVAALLAGDSPTSTLRPGGTADVIIKITNLNTYPVQIYSLTSAGAITADSSHSACTTTGVSFTAPAAPISPTLTVAANSTLLTQLAGAASMNTASMSACQGASFQIPVTVTVRK